MELSKEKKQTVYAFDLDVSDQEHKMLKEFGLKTIKDDDDALINYAVNYILRKEVESYDKTDKTDKKSKHRKKRS